MVGRVVLRNGGLGVSLLALSCVGQVGDRGPGDNPGTPSGQDPGRVTLHRLNRAEYNNTVRDLFGTSLSPADDFPSDDHSYGFDNIADTLTLSPLQLELYERAAETLADEALSIGVASSIDRYEAEEVGGTVGGPSGSAWNLFSNGDVTVTQQIPQGGTFKVRVRAWQDAAGPDDAGMAITIGGTSLGPFDVTGSDTSPQVIEKEIELPDGLATVMVSFTNDYYDEATGADRNLYIDWIEVEGPIGATAENPLRDRIVFCDPVGDGETCVRDVIGTFGRRAFRRPLGDQEVDDLFEIYNLAIAEGDDETEGLKLAIRATLTSAHFLYRVETDEDPGSEVAHPLGPYELASRLSYFLWSSMPDDALLDLAESGDILDPDVLASEVDRMLADPKSEALVENFAGQWLFIRALSDKTPDYLAFPDFDEQLRAAMHEEANAFFREFLSADGPGLDELIAADFVYVNDRLAQHYGLTGSFGPEVVRANVGNAPRGGLLRQGAWLTVTSNPDRTSPVKRGKWILENLLCDAPPPPPPGVEGFKPEDLQAKTQKQLLEQHRANPECAVCHDVMDPLGLALENYDGIGAFRTEDKGYPVDPTGEIDGKAFANPAEFVDALVTDDRLPGCAVEKVFTYALGRGTVSSDRLYIDEIDEGFRDGGLKLRALMKLVATSEPFTYRRGEEGGEL